MDILEDLGYLGWREAVGETCPCAVHDGLVHGQSGGVAHSLVEPEDVSSRVEVEMGAVGYIVWASFLRDAGLEIRLGVGWFAGDAEAGLRGGMNERLDIDVK